MVLSGLKSLFGETGRMWHMKQHMVFLLHSQQSIVVDQKPLFGAGQVERENGHLICHAHWVR